MDPQLIELIKWAGPWAAFILYALKELRERRQIDEMLRNYERVVTEHVQHLTYNTQVLTRLCERIEQWDRQIGQEAGG